MKNLQIRDTFIPELQCGKIISKDDERGYFERVFCTEEYSCMLGRELVIRQINRSMSKIPGTTRGLHFQWPPHAETKIVSCTKGRLLDVAVDLRKDSDTYLQHFSLELTPENKQFLVIPEGFGHGFQTLEPDTEILYLVTADFSLPHDDGVNPADPRLDINWPLDIALMSEKDRSRPYLETRDFVGITLY